MDANILDVSKYFGYAQIFQDVRIYLIGSEYFAVRRYFEMCAYILIGSEYFVCKLIFWQAPIF